MPRFVVLTHDHPVLHWDLMLEYEGHLRTWRLAKPPDAGGPIEAQAIGDHRLAYLDYEGPVSGGRGHVKRWDTGEYKLTTSTPERIVVYLAGERLIGEASLEPVSSSGWIFQLRPTE
jgi:DNA polymerase Ligase (LigD)